MQISGIPLLTPEMINNDKNNVNNRIDSWCHLSTIVSYLFTARLTTEGIHEKLLKKQLIIRITFQLKQIAPNTVVLLCRMKRVISIQSSMQLVRIDPIILCICKCYISSTAFIYTSTHKQLLSLLVFVSTGMFE